METGKKNSTETEDGLIAKSLTMSPEEARRRIVEVTSHDEGRKKELIESGELDAAIASVMLSHIARRFPLATEKQVAHLVDSGWRRALMRFLKNEGRGSAVITGGAIAGGASVVVPTFQELVQLATNAANMNIPRTEALATTILTLTLLTAAVAGPVSYPWRFRARNREESLEAASILRTVLGSDLQNVRAIAMSGDTDAVIKACADRIDTLIGPLDEEGVPRPVSATGRRASLSVSLLGAAALLAITVAAGAKSWGDATRVLEQEARRNPGIALARASNPTKAAQDFMAEVKKGFSFWKGAEDVGAVFGSRLVRNAGIAVGAIEPPRNTHNPGRRTPHKK